MITYNWHFDPLSCYKNIYGYDNVVMKVNLRLEGISGSYYGQVIDVQELQFAENPDTFVEFENLTYDTLLGWVTASLGNVRVNQMKEDIRQQIETKMAAPVIVNLTPPWTL